MLKLIFFFSFFLGPRPHS